MGQIVITAIDSDHFPVRAHETDAGYDVFAYDRHIIPHKGFKTVGVWVKVAMPKGKVCLLFPRSSLFKNYWLLLANSVGVVDAWYRGEIGMQLYNPTDEDVEIAHWEKIWQLIFMDYSTDIDISTHYEDFEDMYPSDRGANGFGSTWN